MTDRNFQAKYNVGMVESVLLVVAAELHPRHLTCSDLALKIVSDPDDSRELATTAQAIRNLRELNLFSVRDDGLVKPTATALRAIALLT